MNIHSKGLLWTGQVISGVIIIFMLFDSITKLLKLASVVEGTLELGYAEHHVVVIGILGLLSTILYAIPRTSVLGAILLTGYFGGAMTTHLRVDSPLFSHTLFALYFAILTWGGIWLRDANVRGLIPIRIKEN